VYDHLMMEHALSTLRQKQRRHLPAGCDHGGSGSSDGPVKETAPTAPLVSASAATGTAKVAPAAMAAVGCQPEPVSLGSGLMLPEELPISSLGRKGGVAASDSGWSQLSRMLKAETIQSAETIARHKW